MPRAHSISRRGFLQTTGAVVAATGAGWALAACGGTVASPSANAATSGSAASSGTPAAGSAVTKASSQSSLGTLKVASTTTAGTQTPLWLADTLHFWTNHGLTVERLTVTSDIGTKTLLAKEIDVLMQSPPPIITANLNGNVDLVYVASVFNHSQFAMAVPAAVQSGADLKGKPIGTDLPGSVNNFQTEVMLGKLGLKDSDVNLIRLESSQGIYAALLAGQIQGAPMGVPQPFQAEGKGFHLLVNTFDIPYQNIGPVVLRSRIPELSSKLGPLLLGIREGIQAFAAQPDLAKQLITTNTKESDAAILQRTYDFYTKDTQFQADLRPTMEGIQSMIDFLSRTILPAAKNAKPEQFVDTSILDQLPKS